MSWRARRVDANQAEIMAAARAMGCSVADTSSIGNGFPDLVIGLVTLKGRINLIVEVKDGAKPPSARKLTGDEREFRDAWRGQYAVVSSIDELRELLAQA